MHHDLKAMRATLRAAHTLNVFADWLRADGGRLLEAVELLGGDRWKIRAETLLTAVSNGTQVVSLRKEFSDLFRLLSLEYTDDLESDEAALFMSVHPDDPRADNARVCAEALQRGLCAIKQLAATNKEAA